MSQSSKIVLAVIVTAIIVGGGVYYWQSSKTLQIQNSQSELTNKKTYVFEKYGISLEYDSTWSVRKGYNKEGIIIEAPDQQSEKGTLVSFHPDLGDSDIGMGYKTVSTKNYTNPNGVTFNVSFMEEDPSFPRTPGEKINPNFVYVIFDLDALPGAHVFSYYKDINSNGEQEFWEMVNSFKNINVKEKTTVSGDYEYYVEGMVAGQVCFMVDDKSSNLVSFSAGGKPWFCFENNDRAKKLFEINETGLNSALYSCVTGKAKIEISNFVDNYIDASAILEQVFSKEPYVTSNCEHL